MSAKSIAVFIAAVSFYLYVAFIVALAFEDFPDIIVHAVALIALLWLYSHLVVRGLKAYDRQMLAELQARHGYLCVGASTTSQYAVGSDSSGVTVYRLGNEGASVEESFTVPHDDVSLEAASPALVDRGASVQIRRTSDSWALNVGLMDVDEARGMTVVDYLRQRLGKSRRDGSIIVDKLLQARGHAPAQPAAAPVVRAARGDNAATTPVAPTGRAFLMVVGGTMLGAVLALVLAVATIAAFDAQARKEMLIHVTTCERPQSAIATTAANETIRVPGATITLKNVIYNVPQRSKRPQPYAYECQKATLVEVVIELTDDRPPAGEELDEYDFELRTPLDDDVNMRGQDEEFTWYAEREGLELLDYSSFDDIQGPVRGWMLFPVADTTATTDQVFGYDSQYSDVEKFVPLPEPSPVA